MPLVANSAPDGTQHNRVLRPGRMGSTHHRAWIGTAVLLVQPCPS
jgi:hypothetical protein